MAADYSVTDRFLLEPCGESIKLKGETANNKTGKLVLKPSYSLHVHVDDSTNSI